MNRIFRFAVATLVALPMFAADLGAFSKWPDSPQGYFMTKAERQQWEALTTEADAGKFVKEFLGKREPGFAAEVAKRAEQADKYLTIADRPGSKTLRGKVVVLFGPPSGLNISNRSNTTTKRDNPIMAGALSNAGGIGSTGRGGDSTTPTGGSISTSQGVRVYSITFSGEATTKTIDKQSVTFIIDADAATGKDEWASRSAGKEAEELFELAARASIVKK
ncbi:MAG TPA: GWxTD domain-containing protein [Thermoanaerobaculia bacterium]|jgi:GWxTD domain-containing protein|nr:GWxTD domain-containing protein [Thermoanaerobaculia bacterium]